MTSLLLFGAGASSGQAGRGLPPLGAQLFQHLASRGGNWSADDLRDRFDGKDFEAAMHSLLQPQGEAVSTNPSGSREWQWSANTPPSRPVNLQWDIAEFFFKLELIPDSTYECFVNRARPALSNGSLRVATLNYDRLLFLAFEKASLAFRVTGEDSPPARICLPHGSSALAAQSALRTNGRLEATSNVELVPTRDGGFETYGEVSYVSNLNDFESTRRDNYLPPVMSFIEPTKTAPTATNYIHAEQQRWARWVGEAKRIALVGVRVHEVDRHIWGPLSSTSAKLMYVGGSSAAEFDTWRRARRREESDTAPRLWHDAFEDVLAFLEVA